MTKQNGWMIAGLALALIAALLFGGYIPALAQDGGDEGDGETPPFTPPCLSEDFEWSEDMPHGPGMMWFYYGEDLPEDFTAEDCPMWQLYEGELPEGWSDDMPHGPGMMWYYYNGEELPEDWADFDGGCPMWGEGEAYGPGMMWQYYNGDDLPEGYGPGMMGRGGRGRGMMGGRGPGMMWQ